MTKTFDQICKGILGEMVTAPTMAPGQPQQTGQPTPSSQPITVDPAIIKLIINAKDDKTATAALAAYTQSQSSQTKPNPSQPAQQPTTSTQPATQQQNAAKRV